MATPRIPQSTSSMIHSIDLKANGEVSRMRSHKGNMPSLPQTKYCSLCPAKFTRTTHLNRHLRSHTNERSHRCNICGAEFTRSDLLTRHKRTCGDSNANRSRRKSCQACAESKVKCNLQYPCSKCASRGKECIFINDPETSRNKRNSRKGTYAPRSSSSGSVSSVASSILGSEALSGSPPPYSPAYLATINDSTPPVLSLDTAISMNQYLGGRSLGPPSLSNSSNTSPHSSSRGSPRSDGFENDTLPGAFDLTFDSFALEAQLNNFFPNAIFEPFVDNISSCEIQDERGILPQWLDDNELFTGYSNDDPFSFNQPGDIGQDFTGYSALPNTTALGNAEPSFSAITPSVPISGYNASEQVGARSPGPEELDHYCYLFFNAFCPQIPLFHRATWRADGKPAILIRAMQACGALFVKSETSMQFVRDTLRESREVLLDLAKSAQNIGEQVHLILALVLLQTIGLFHQRQDERVPPNLYHGLLAMLIRRTGLLGLISAWKPSEIHDLSSAESAWKDWSQYETIKRALFLAYLQDCTHCMYFAIPPSFHPSEFVINLPCDDELWEAGNAMQWYQLQQQRSPYGVGPTRSAGASMQQALNALTDTQSSAVSVPLNPFSHFILIHTILRNIYASPTVPGNIARPGDDPMLRSTEANVTREQHLFAIQYMLHNWQQMWSNSPEVGRFEKTGEEPPFVSNVLPFYWLAQVAIAGLQDGTIGVDESRNRLLRESLHHIRIYLRSGSQMPNQLWDDLLKVRHRLSISGGQSNIQAYPDSLLV